VGTGRWRLAAILTRPRLGRQLDRALIRQSDSSQRAWLTGLAQLAQSTALQPQAPLPAPFQYPGNLQFIQKSPGSSFDNLSCMSASTSQRDLDIPAFAFRLLGKGYLFSLRLPLVGKLIRPVAKTYRYRTLNADARRLHDILEATPLANRYWLWGGGLLGWAREGRLLRHDPDLDFAVDDRYLEELVRAIPQIVAGGFRPLYWCFNNNDVLTEICFERNSHRFEFFLMTLRQHRYYYFLYGPLGSETYQLETWVPRQELVEFSFLGRRWWKAADHEAELGFIYGDWHTPDPTWNYMSSGVGGKLTPWKHSRPLWPRHPDGSLMLDLDSLMKVAIEGPVRLGEQ
jgi:hypothetical protein